MRTPLLVAVPLLLLIFGFEFLPAVRLLLASVVDKYGDPTAENFREVLFSPYYRAAMRNSLLLSGWSTVLGLALSLLGAYALHRSGERVRRVMTTLIGICVNFAGVPLAFAFMIILGSSGVVANAAQRAFGLKLYDYFDLYSWTGLALAYVYFQIPLGTLLLYPAFSAIRRDWQEAAANLGATPWRFWRHVGLPVLAPAVFGTASILFANALGAQATAYALTNGMYNIMTVRIGRLVSGDVNYRPNEASAAALVVAAMMVGALLVNRWMMRRYRSDAV